MDDLLPTRTVTDPASGETQLLAPGDRVELRLTCRNDADKVVTFTADAQGLGPWAETKPRPVAPFDVGSLAVGVAVPADARSGDYPFTVRLLLNGDPVTTVAGTLRVRERTPASGECAAGTSRSEPAGVVPRVDPDLTKPSGTADPRPIRQPDPRVVKLEAPEPVEEPPLAISADRRLDDPVEGAVVALKPGETALVAFSVHNDQAAVRTFVLQEDRSLANDWIGLVRDQVNVVAGGSGDVALLLKPPVGAEPGGYPFTASFGVLGQPLASCYLTLQVLPVPAVALSAPKTSNSVFAPLARAVAFDLKVASDGNTDTAYRVAVVEEAADEAGATRVGETYETSAWRYVFDKEIDSLVSPRAGAPATAVTHRLRLVRKGVWWLGWRERHRVDVRAIPVTDPTNGAKGGNVASLTAARWRVLPVPALVALPLALLGVVLLASGTSRFRVTNARQGDDGTYYVVGPLDGGSKGTVHLRWDAPPYALLRLDRVQEGADRAVAVGRGEAADRPPVAEYGQAQRTGYEVGPRLLGSPERLAVRFVPTRTKDQLQIVNSHQAVKKGTTSQEAVGEDGTKLLARDVDVVVPRDRDARLTFRNLTGKTVDGQTIVLWTVHAPPGFVINDFLTSGGNQPINPGASLVARIRVNGSAPPTGEETWEMLTTDGANQLLRLHLKAANP